MDFDYFLVNPADFIHQLAQNETEEQDLGLKNILDSHFESNKEDFYKIPIVSTLEDMQKTPPGQIVRLRCSLLEYSAHEMFPYRFLSGGEYHSCLLKQTLPESESLITAESMADRECFTAMSVRPMTDWFRAATAVQVNRRNTSVFAQKKGRNGVLRNTPFEVTVKAAFQYSNATNFDLVDFVGAFVEDSMEDELLTGDAFSKSLPTFIAFTYKPSLLMQSVGESYDIKEMYSLVMQVLSSIFEPAQAKVFLIWLLSNVEYFIGQTPIGGFNLNFTGATHEIAEVIDIFLKSILPLYQMIAINDENLNGCDMKPSITQFGAEEQSPLLCSEGTKYLIEETEELTSLDQTGVNNLNLIKSSIYSNQINADFYDAEYTFYMNNTVLSLSTNESVFSNHLSINIGTVSPIPEISEEQLNAIRTYFAVLKNTKFDISNTDNGFLQARLLNFKKAHKNVSQEKLQLLVLFMQNIAKSIGEDVISEEICNEAEELLAACISE